MTIHAAGHGALLGDPLARRSIEVLKRGQAPSGAIIASPSFPTYAYAWLRDGAFCAHALDLAGETAAAAGFHRWATRSVEARRPMIEAVIERVAGGETPPAADMPPARYTLAGDLERGEDGEAWPNFQIDGYGIWLWALDAHLAGAAPDPGTAATIRLVARYLESSWRLRCFSCWEEYDDGEHGGTLGAVVAGIDAAGRLLRDDSFAGGAHAVRERLLGAYVVNGRFRRGPRDDRLDGSLLWLSVPFGVLPPGDARIAATIEAVHRQLAGPGGGVYRYVGDTYYGGGQWLLLTSSLAWHESVAGTPDVAVALQDWVRTQARPNGDLPEQVTGCAQDPAMVEPWVDRWGPVATPLLWSHAMYLIAEAAAR